MLVVYLEMAHFPVVHIALGLWALDVLDGGVVFRAVFDLLVV